MALTAGKALRVVFGEALADLGNDDPRIVVLDGDVGGSTGAAAFEAAHPERFLQMGITEQAMLGAAAGLATVGFVPVAASFACFAVGRGFDAIRVLIAQPGLSVKIAAARRPAHRDDRQDASDVRRHRHHAHATEYDRAGAGRRNRDRAGHPGDDRHGWAVLPAAHPGGIAGAVPGQLPLRDRPGSPATDRLRCHAHQHRRADGPYAEAAGILAGRGIEATVLHVPTVKPIDADAIVEAALASGLVVTVEEQSVLGGLGGAVAEVLTAACPVPVRRLGLQDVFGESGPENALLEKYRLSAAAVAADVEAWLEQSPTVRAAHLEGAER